MPESVCDIFIKTYAGDIPWLQHCLASIKKYGSGFGQTVIAVDRDCHTTARKMARNHERVVTVSSWKNGYIQQQAIKMAAHRYTASENILFVDSDCVFFRPFSPSDFMKDGRPVLLKERYGNLGGGECWRPITSQFIGWDVEWEYMRRLPAMYAASTLSAIKDKFPDMRSKLERMESRAFSEFNFIGAFIDRYEKEKYSILDVREETIPTCAKQFWSWGGITPEVKAEIEQMLNGTWPY